MSFAVLSSSNAERREAISLEPHAEDGGCRVGASGRHVVDAGLVPLICRAPVECARAARAAGRGAPGMGSEPVSLTLPFSFALKRSALVVVDMQNDFVREGAPLCVPDAKATLEPTNGLIRFFREHRRPVAFTRFVAGENPSLLWTWSPQIREPVNCCRIGYRRYYEDIAAERECTAVVDELDTEPSDIFIDKYWYGAFCRTNLKDALLSYNADAVVITGTVTQICVEDTARQAFHEGFKVIVVEDCVSSFDPELHRATLRNLGMKFGATATARAFLDFAGKRAAKAA